MSGKLLLLLNGCCLLVLVRSAEWDYKDNGPATWADNYADCGGQKQSPIDIVTASATIDYDLPIVNRSYFYNPPSRMTVVNNGHTILIGFDEGAYTINDLKLLPFEAKIVQYHFHWGSPTTTEPSTLGSEHTLNGARYYGELHAVHMNTKYANISEAIDKDDGLAVFGWFVQISYPQTNQDMKHFLDVGEDGAQKKGDEKNVAPVFSLETLLPPDLNVYYRYKGSLTTPGCYESVVWTVFEKPIEITEAQANRLASIFYSTNTTDNVLINNFRPVQPLNGRKLTKPAPLVQDSGASASHASLFIVLIASALMFVFN